ncbi:MAG: PSD1 domain-containing protein [Planctomycetes bacterium]|nr:PSD1 domain-containing protein [Planctomycetota bacterium]
MLVPWRTGFRFRWLTVAVLSVLNHSVFAAEPLTTEQSRFEKSVGPLLIARCVACHSGSESKGSLDLTTRDQLIKGGENGPALAPGMLERSLIWQRILAEEMPPKHPLSAAEKATIQEWIQTGATWSGGPLDPLQVSTDQRAGFDWWSLQPIRQVAPPAVHDVGYLRQPVDAFIQAQLEQHGLQPAQPADRRVLIRRLTFDLIGLPPSPADVDEFVNEARPDAVERLIDRLLASPHYGERWARHWLDVVRFGESNGFERDLPRPNAWPYRDWVIQALNRDLPYDEFVRWQLAGDIIAPNDPDAIRSVGFLVAGAHDTVVPVVDRMRALMRQDELEDTMGVVGQTFLGLTLNCARCHDHKFDPITAREYYQFASALAGVDHGERELAETKTKIYSAIATQPPPMKIHKRGSVSMLGDEVAPAGLRAVQGLDPSFGLTPDAIESHRRLKLANWVTDVRNPLFSRVMVNRIWHYHFGTGLVETPSDLGFNGGKPSHPELLEWLAGEFAGAGFEGNSPRLSVKRMHRLLLSSATYQQSSVFNVDAARGDAGNRLLWRMNPHRLEAEAVRDAMLSVAGQLNTEIGGKGYADVNSYFFKGTQFYDPIDPVAFANNRRTVYRMWARGGRSPFLDTFDCPDPSSTTPRRSATVTPLQALSLLNHSFSLRMAARFADRLLAEAGPDPRDQVQWAYRLLYGRNPTVDEASLSEAFVQRQGREAFCRAMWNSSEFLFLD